MTDTVGALRRFNRTHTLRVGALEESFLGLGMPLRKARALYEVGHEGAAGLPVATLRLRLGLDSGHSSRLLRALEDRNLVLLLPDPADRRRRRIELTDEGRSVFDRLEERSIHRARSVLEPLSQAQRERLAAALSQAETLLRASGVELREVPLDDPGLIGAVGSYLAELQERFGDDFDPGPVLAQGRYLVAIYQGEVVACGGIQTIAAGVAEIKRMWVEPGWRGAGLGSRTLGALEAMAAEEHALARLDTHGSLHEAVTMYERAGYRSIARYNDNPHAEHFFEKRLDPSAPRPEASGSTGR